jgi:phosphoglycerate dehydrogenase-like enzyme
MKDKPRILVLNATCLDIVEEHRAWIEARGVELVAKQSFRRLTPAQVGPLLAEANAVVLPASCPVTAADMEGSTQLKSLSIAASGYEWLDLPAATRCGIIVTNAPVGEGAEVVADMAWGLMLAVARQIPFHDRAIQIASTPVAGEGLSEHEKLMRHSQPPRGIGTSVWGKTLGIVGLGNIGKAVARRAVGFDMRVLASTPHPDRDFAMQHKIEIVSLDELLQRSDFVSLHARLNPQTQGMIGARELDLMKPSAFLINTARQQLVDWEALTEAILRKCIAGAALDDPPVDPDTPLLGLPNVVFTTHLGNRAAEGMHAVFKCAIENILDVFAGKQPAYLLNPGVYAVLSSKENR